MLFLRSSLIAWLLSFTLFLSANAQTDDDSWQEESFYYDGHTISLKLPESFKPYSNTRYVNAELGMAAYIWVETFDFTECDNGDKACAIAQLPPKVQAQVTLLKINDFDAFYYAQETDRYTYLQVLFFINRQALTLSMSYTHEGDRASKQALADQIVKSLFIEKETD